MSESLFEYSHAAMTAALRKSGLVFAEEEAQMLLAVFDSEVELSRSARRIPSWLTSAAARVR